MKRIMTPLLFASIIGTSGLALAADPMPSDSMSNSSMTASQQSRMNHCMTQQKAQDSSMSKEDMKKACMAKMKMTPPMGHSPGNQTTPTTDGQPSPATGSETTPPTTPPK